MTKTPRDLLGSTADEVADALVDEYTSLHHKYAATQAAAPTAGDDLYGAIWTVMHHPVFAAVQHLQPVSDHIRGSRVKFAVLFGRVMLLGWRDARGGRRFGTSRSRIASLDVPVPVQLALLTDVDDQVLPAQSERDDTAAILEAAAAKNLDVIMVVLDSTATQLDRITWGIPSLDGDRLVLESSEVLYQAAAIEAARHPQVASPTSHSDGAIPERVVRRRPASGEQ